VLMGELIHRVEVQAIVDCQFGQQAPFILNVDAIQPAGVRQAIDDIERLVGGLSAAGIYRQHARQSVGPNRFRLCQEPGTQRVLFVDPPAAVSLHAGRDILPRRPLRDAIEHQVADPVRLEIQRAGAVEQRDL
jgi:hypothetical protein